ncbi:MAG: hypothetical protein ACW981_12180 [Candidatus Hodarchaeales archaeon]|jgi:hypothetical protein
MQKKEKLRGKHNIIYLIVSISLLLYSSYYYLAINENKINLTDGYWTTGCGGSLFPFPIDHGHYNTCPAVITPMSETDQIFQQIYIKLYLYVATMLISWIILGISIRKYINEKSTV